MQITETTFPKNTYLALKKTVPFSKVTDKQMYDEAGKKLGAYIAANNIQVVGAWSVMYFTWDMEKGSTDLAIAFPVTGVTEVTDPEFSLVEMPEAKAVLGVMEGSYDKLKETHEEMLAYMKEHNLDDSGVMAMAVEEYIVGPMQDEQESNWRTNVYYLHS